MSTVTNATIECEMKLTCTLAQKELLKVVYSAYFENQNWGLVRDYTHGTSPGLVPNYKKSKLEIHLVLKSVQVEILTKFFLFRNK